MILKDAFMTNKVKNNVPMPDGEIGENYFGT